MEMKTRLDGSPFSCSLNVNLEKCSIFLTNEIISHIFSLVDFYDYANFSLVSKQFHQFSCELKCNKYVQLGPLPQIIIQYIQKNPLNQKVSNYFGIDTDGHLVQGQNFHVDVTDDEKNLSCVITHLKAYGKVEDQNFDSFKRKFTIFEKSEERKREIFIDSFSGQVRLVENKNLLSELHYVAMKVIKAINATRKTF